MKQSLFFIAAAVAVFVFTGCVQINSSDGGSMNIMPQTVGPTDNYRPIYKVDESNTVTASSEVKNILGIFTWGSDNAFADNAFATKPSLLGAMFPYLNAKTTACKAAFYKACKEAQCDTIVAARYEITSEDYLVFRQTKVEIKGFPAKITGVETVKPLPYYIDGKGNVVKTDNVVTPHCLFDARNGAADSDNPGLIKTIIAHIF